MRLSRPLLTLAIIVLALALVTEAPWAQAKEEVGVFDTIAGYGRALKNKLLPPSCPTPKKPPELVEIDPKKGRSYCCPHHDVELGGFACGDIFPCEPYYPKNPCKWTLVGENAKLKVGCTTVRYTQDWFGSQAAQRKADQQQAKARLNRPCCRTIEGAECGKELPYFSHELCTEYCGKEYGAGYCEEHPAAKPKA